MCAQATHTGIFVGSIDVLMIHVAYLSTRLLSSAPFEDLMW